MKIWIYVFKYTIQRNGKYLKTDFSVWLRYYVYFFLQVDCQDSSKWTIHLIANIPLLMINDGGPCICSDCFNNSYK